MVVRTKLKVVIVVFLSLYCLSLNAQTSKGAAEIKSFAIDSMGNLTWEIEYTSKEVNYQIEFFQNGEWLVNSSFKEKISLLLPGQKEEFTVKKSIKGSQISRYRLRVTEPVNIISKEINYGK